MRNPRLHCAGLSVFFLSGLLSHAVQASPMTLDRLEASANSTIILQSDIRNFRKTQDLRLKLDPLFASTSIASRGSSATDSEIREFLIDEKIILQQYPLSDSEVETEINGIQAGNRIDRNALKKALAEQGYSFEDYFDLIRAGAAKRNLIDRDIRTKVTVSDDDVKNYFYNKYARNFSAPLEYKIKIVSVTIKNWKSPEAAREVLVRARDRLRAGETFEEVARQVSDHPSASGGGDLGTLTEDQMSGQIREQVRKLKIGQISDIFGGKEAGAFFLVKIQDIQSNDSDRLNKVKEEIRNQLTTAEFQHQIQLWLERQRQGAFVHRLGDRSSTGTAAPSAPSP